MADKTSIQLSRETKARLDKLGIKGDTYNDILCRLLDQVGGKGRKHKAAKQSHQGE